MVPLVEKTKKTRKKKIPDYLIAEVMDGVPYYYKGYRKVLNNQTTLEAIMGSSALQFVLLEYLLSVLFKSLDRKKYFIGNNEAGLHLGLRDNISSDIAIFDKKLLTPDKIVVRYADVPPEMVVEVDSNVETEDDTDKDYVNLKTQKLLDFGVKKVIWIFSKSKKVMVATPQQPWLTYNWNTTLELWNGTTFNIADYLDAEGIKVE